MNRLASTPKAKRIVTAILVMVMCFSICSTALGSAGGANIGEGSALFTNISNAIKSVVGGILSISTIVAVLALAIALIIRYVSKNQRAVDESNSWIKRIIISWLILNCLALIMSYGQDLVTAINGDNSIEDFIGTGGGTGGGGIG